VITMQDRYRGCLVGLAAGDALGGPVEFISRQELATRFPDGVRDFTGGGWLSLESGEITDDTQMTLDLARSLAVDGTVNLPDLARRFVQWAAGHPKDIGATTRTAIAQLAEGVAWDEAGERVYRESLPKGAAGNGSVMRCAPVALRFRTDPHALVRVSIDTARMTHADPRCTAGAVVVNQAIASLLEDAPPEAAIAASLSGVDQADLVKAIRALPELEWDQIRSGGYVVDTVTAAFKSLLVTASFEEAVVTAVSLGDDADTTGAVAGALAGARYGVAAIPERWYGAVQHREELQRLADRLLFLSGR
jgi:ADP-ribosyl-[dinitrogen reductase] hydrolase